MSSRGFTLIEIMVAILVLTIAVLGLASVLAGTSRRQEHSVSHAELAAAAESKFEDLRGHSAAGGADTLQLTLGGSLVQNEAVHADTLVTAYGRAIRRRWVVVDGPAGTRDVTLLVRPETSARNDSEGLTFRTLIVAP